MKSNSGSALEELIAIGATSLLVIGGCWAGFQVISAGVPNPVRNTPAYCQLEIRRDSGERRYKALRGMEEKLGEAEKALTDYALPVQIVPCVPLPIPLPNQESHHINITESLGYLREARSYGCTSIELDDKETIGHKLERITSALSGMSDANPDIAKQRGAIAELQSSVARKADQVRTEYLTIYVQMEKMRDGK